MKCHSCGKEIDESSFSTGLTYCPYCGHELEAARLQFCPYCGQKLAAQTNFCPHCGKKLALAKKKPIVEQTVKDFIEEREKQLSSGQKRNSKLNLAPWGNHNRTMGGLKKRLRGNSS